MAAIWLSEGARRRFAAQLIGVVKQAKPGECYQILYPAEANLPDQAARQKFGLQVRQWATRAGAGSVSVNPGPTSCKMFIGWKI